MGLPCAARALALVALLASGCTLGLDWSPNAITSPDASAIDRALPDIAPPPQDLGAPDAPAPDLAPAPDTPPPPDASPPDAEPQPDAPAVDSGAVDTGVVTGRCGGHDERCCSFGACMMGRICLQRMGEAAVCRDCGGNNQPCCLFGACDGMRRCELRMDTPVCR